MRNKKSIGFETFENPREPNDSLEQRLTIPRFEGTIQVEEVFCFTFEGGLHSDRNVKGQTERTCLLNVRRPEAFVCISAVDGLNEPMQQAIG